MNHTEHYCENCGAHNAPDEKTCFSCGHTLTGSTTSTQASTADAHILHQRYRLLDIIGEGGFSAVYKAQDVQSGRLVAVKAVTLRNLSAQQKIEATDAFNREVHMLTRLVHRNLPRLYDHFSDTECWYMVMDFIEGTTLEKRLEQMNTQTFFLEEVLDIGLLLCDVLHYLHSQEPAIIFRDLKPANIMLTRDGHLYLIDFGIARQFKPGKTKDTIPFGSPGYAAPEQYGKTQTTPRTDIYSLGAILHQLLSGHDPSHTPFSFAPLRRPELAELETFLLRMVSMDASERPESIDLVRQTLRRFASGTTRQHGLYAHSGASSLHLSPADASLPWPPTSTLHTYSGSSSSAGQRQAFQQQAQTYAQPLQAAPRRSNRFAIASLTFSILGIFMPVIFWVMSILFMIMVHDVYYSIGLFGLLLMNAPSVLAVIFGHIGRHRARTVAGMNSSLTMATIGLVLGYIFGSVYFLCSLGTLMLILRQF